MTEDYRWREKTRHMLESYFLARSFPRFALGLILAMTGGVGFGISFFLLRAGVGQMWIRYPVAVIGAYGIFILFMRGWVELERMRIDPKALAEIEKIQGSTEGRMSESKIPDSPDSSWWNWLNWWGTGDVIGEGCLPTILVFVALVLGVMLFGFLTEAPALLAEVFIDVILTSMVYRRLRNAARRHWFGTAIRRTWIYVLWTAVLLGAAGACLSHMAPGSKSIGPALRHIFR